MKALKYILLLAALTISGAALAQAAKEDAQKPNENAKLTLHKNKNGIDGVLLEVYIKGEIEDIWKIITDPKMLPELYTSMKKVERLEKQKSDDEKIDINLWRYTLDSPLGDKVLTVRTRDEHARFRTSWIRTEGDLAHFGGVFILKKSEDHKGYVRLVYRNYVDGGKWVPQWITNKLNQKDAANMVGVLKKKLFEMRKSRKEDKGE